MSIKSKFFTKWGTNALKINDTDIALQMFDKAIKADPKDSKPYITKIITLGNMGQYKEALKILYQAKENNIEDIEEIDGLKQSLIEEINNIKTGKNVAIEYCNKGIVFLNQLQQFEKAIEMFDKAIEIDPQFEGAYLSKGSALGQLGQTEESIEMFNKVLEINPQYAKAYYNKGVALKVLGKNEDALQMFNKAREIDPDLIYEINLFDRES